MTKTSVGVSLLTNTARLPERAHASDAAFDLYSDQAGILEPGAVLTVSTGVALDLPEQLHALVLSRSGLAAKSGVFVLNSPGLIDSGYRGEVKVILCGVGDKRMLISQGDRIAQILFQDTLPVGLDRVDRLSPSDRGDKGLGSTGITSKCPHTNIVQEHNGAFICTRCYMEVTARDLDKLM